jgi:ribosome maturation factor RimP
MFELIQEKANEQGYELLKVERYPNKDDHFLRAVICLKEDEYVQWIYNVNDHAFYSGYYTKSLEEAKRKLNNRISK